MITGTDPINAACFTIAILFGLLAMQVAGGYRTLPGVLNLVMLSKFLLIAVFLKTVTWQAMDSQLKAPRATAEVMALGFIGLFVATWLYRVLIHPPGLIGDVKNPRSYLALTIVFLVASFVSAFSVLVFATSYDLELTGGLWGVAHNLATYSSFCIVPAMYYAWSSGAKRFLSHPLVVGILTLEIIYGIMSTTKQSMMEPLLCFFIVGFIRYGLRNKTLWSLVAMGLALYSLIIYPYSQYVRDHGGRDGDLSSRLAAIQEVFFNISTNSDFRDMVETKISYSETYLGKDSLAPFSRLAMVGEADRLIAATDATQSYSGWDTIVFGLRLMVPSFILPDKPLSGGGNYLGHIAGDVADYDESTQISYGVMANLFNAFSFKGVLIGSILFFLVFYYAVRFWYRDPILSFGPYGTTHWYILLAVAYEHSLIEAPIGNLLPGLINSILVVGLVFAAKILASLLPASLGTDPGTSNPVSASYLTAGTYR